MRRDEILKTLKALKGVMKSSYKATLIGVFGSLARGEESETSDIDVLVEFDKNADLFDFVGLSLFLEERFGRSVDVVPKEDIRKEIRSAVLKDLVYI